MADNSDSQEIRCSFCHKDKDQVEGLIAGSPGVYICHECVDLCNEILKGKKEKQMDPALLTNGSDSQKLSECPFCNKDSNQVKKLIANYMAAICNEWLISVRKC